MTPKTLTQRLNSAHGHVTARRKKEAFSRQASGGRGDVDTQPDPIALLRRISAPGSYSDLPAVRAAAADFLARWDLSGASFDMLRTACPQHSSNSKAQ
jgi:hypothetical protein